MEYSQKVQQMAQDALKKHLEELNTQEPLHMDKTLQEAWIQGYAHALHTLGIDLEGELFSGL